MDVFIFENLDLLPTIVLGVIIVGMLFVLSKGADILVDQAVSLSVQWGVPKVVIGATIVSLGTTLPEASVSVLAAINNNPDLALGNAIGSIIADTGLIIGLAALLGKLPVDQVIVKRQGKIQVAAGFLLALVSIPFFTQGQGNISQWMGGAFLVLLIIYIYFSIKWTKAPLMDQNDLSYSDELNKEQKKSPLFIRFLKLFIGIALVIISSKILIPTVEITAVRVGIPQSIIAATLVALGTSLPELVTAITAVRKGHGELAIGNVVGADILNVLFVVGGAAAVTSGGLAVPVSFYKLQIPTMLVILVIFRLFTRGKNEQITKLEGSILFLIYIAYIVLSYTWLRT